MAHEGLGLSLPLWSVVPFASLLLAIAILPLAVPKWWEHNRNKGIVSLLCALPILIYFGFILDGGRHELANTAKEYAAFLTLLASLYIISGGIYVRGSLSGTPLANTGLLAIGTLLASVIGTTGASMLLIRPLLRANESRRDKAHIVVFFIFLVSNIGGSLTPLGDPPLFLGFLRGVPFEWTLRLAPQWLVACVVLLILFNLYDQHRLAVEEKERPGSQFEEVEKAAVPIRIEGGLNVVWLLGVVAAIFFAGWYGNRAGWSPDTQKIVQVIAMLAMAEASLSTTRKEVREANRFTYGPIIEVAVLFAGIFATMVPALLILEARGGEMGVTEPWQFFWATGMLSSFLDNAPTYLTFSALACGLLHVDASHLGNLLDAAGGPALLTAISCGAVFMGANTYIGNGPNFMVKAVAEESGVKMPSFFGYMAWSTAVLVPLFIVITLVFFR
ncbi:MAG: sodium:proton antiporter [Planctomycetes bacterium]|nr:sodium:proton antiporter [Planctomycetota bacterium]